MEIKPSELVENIALLQQIYDPLKPVLVFGGTPGKITSVTVSATGNLVLVYEELFKEETQDHGLRLVGPKV